MAAVQNLYCKYIEHLSFVKDLFQRFSFFLFSLLIDKSDFLFAVARFCSKKKKKTVPRVSTRTKGEGTDLLSNLLNQRQKISLKNHLE